MAGQLWVTNSLGGFLYSDKLSKELRYAVQPLARFRQFSDVKDAAHQGQKKGDLFYWDQIIDITRGSRTLTETSTIPEDNFLIQQGTGTLEEFGRAVPYTGKLQAMSMFDVKKIVNQTLANDAAKALDARAFTEFNKCQLRAVSTASAAVEYSTNGTASATNSVALFRKNATMILDTMRERNIPAYSGNDYVCIAHPTTLRQIRDDLTSIFQYTAPGARQVMEGEIGMADSCRYVEQTCIPKGGAADSTTFNAYTGTADNWNNGASSWAFFFGADTVAEGVAIPEEMRAKIPTDYGRSQGVAWYALLGYAIMHNWTSYPAECRILKWDSAV